MSSAEENKALARRFVEAQDKADALPRKCKTS
jgi:hypothetical protein